MTYLCRDLNSRGYAAETWQQITGDNVLFRKICDAIYSHDVLVAEVSELNPNVLMEVGYALAVGRDPILLVDKNRDQPRLAVLGTKDQCHYGSRQDILAWIDKYFDSRTYSDSPNRIIPLLNEIDPAMERAGHVYYIPASIDDISNTIFQKIKEINKIYSGLQSYSQSDPTDSLFDNFREQARNIAQAEYVIGSLVSSQYKNAVEKNASVAVLLGVAVGFGKRVLVLQEEPSRLVLDLGTVLHRFKGEKQASEITEQWFRQQITGEDREVSVGLTSEGDVTSPPPVSANRSIRMRRRRARVQFFGSPDAHFDYDLMDYFVETPEFCNAVRGQREILIGRKGAGKSANFKALEVALKADRQVIPVMITPLDLDYEQLVSILDQLGVNIHPNFLYPSFWRFIIYTEMVKVLIEEGSRFLSSSALQEGYRKRIEGVANELSGPIAMDFSSRIMDILKEANLRSRSVGLENIQTEVERVVGQSRLYGLEDALIELSNTHKFYVAIDDIDKHWQPNSATSISWLRGLLNEVDTIRRRFHGGLHSAILLREDMYEFIKKEDTDFANRSIASLNWSHQWLSEVIASRIEFLSGVSFQTTEEAWFSVFPTMVRGRRVDEYMIERTLYRPRDLIHFCQLALEESQRRGRQSVIEEDILQAEGNYSKYIIDSVRTEFLFTYAGIDIAFFKFAKGPAVLHDYSSILEDCVESLSETGETWASDIDTVMRALYEVGFLGLSDIDQDDVWFSSSRKFEDALGITGPNRVVVVHPAFHVYLQIGD